MNSRSGTENGTAGDATKADHLDKWCAALRREGYRITSARLQLVVLILTGSDPVTANSLFEQVKVKRLKLGLATIYRTLETLERLELLRRVHDSQGCHSYVPADSQALLAVCQACGQVDVLVDKRLQELLVMLPREKGYQVNEVFLQVMGLCANCR